MDSFFSFREFHGLKEIIEGLLPWRKFISNHFLIKFIHFFDYEAEINHNFISWVHLQSFGIDFTRESLPWWRLKMSSYSRWVGPTYICLGRLILFGFSFIISHQCAIQPMLLDTAKRTVNMSLGMPIAL